MASKESNIFSNTTRHLARKLNQQVSRVRDSSLGFPSDVLNSSQVDFQFIQHIGFPEAADGVAYEPIQKLLAVSTSDGCVKVIGEHGVEVTLRGDSTSSTKFLCFMRHRGGLLRVTEDGVVQLFSVPGRRLLATVCVEGNDVVNTVAAVPGGPYVMMGCESGNCRIVLVSSRTGTSGGGIDNGTDPAAGLVLQPYQILGEDLDASGGVVALAITRNEDRPLALIVHRNSGATVWDIRAERMLGSVPDEEDDPSKPTCACWVGERSNCFAVGYDDGSVLLWGVPSTALKSNKVTASESCVLIMSLRVAPEGVQAAPIHSLTYLAGEANPTVPGGEDCLLVRGGQPVSDPDMLTLMPLDPEGKIPPSTIPWFGTIKAYTMMPSSDRDRTYDGILVLTEGGQLVVHNLHEWHPYPLTLPFQELPSITVTKFVPALSKEQATVLTSEGQNEVQHALTFPAVLEAAKSTERTRGLGLSDWPFTGGEPAFTSPASVAAGCHPSAFLFSGHRDGKTRIWNSTTQIPTLITTIPSSLAAGQDRIRPVSAIDVCPASGIVVVGHVGGDVRVYQFCDRPQPVHRVTIDESLVPYDTMLAQPAGFQYIMKYSAHSVDCTALCLASKLKLLAVGDAVGNVSVIDLMAPQRVLQTTAAPNEGVAALAFGLTTTSEDPSQAAVNTLDSGAMQSTVPQQQQQQLNPSSSAHSVNQKDVYVFITSRDSSSLTTVSMLTGTPVSRPVKPKNISSAVNMVLLDAYGVPILPLQGSVILQWADNNAASTQRSLSMMAVKRHDTSLSRSAGGGFHSRNHQNPPVAALEVQPLPSDEDDELDAALQAAATAVDERNASEKGINRFTSIFTRNRNRTPSPEKKQAAAVAENTKRNKTPNDNDYTKDFIDNPEHDPTNPFYTPPHQHEYVLTNTSVQQRASSSSHPNVNAKQDHLHDDNNTTSNYNGTGAERANPSEYGDTYYEDDYGIDTSADLFGNLQANDDVSAFLSSKAQAFMDYPYLDFLQTSDTHQSSVAYVLVITRDCARVYSMESIKAGDRTSEKKVKFDQPITFAGTFLSESGPGIVTLTSQTPTSSTESIASQQNTTAALGVYSIPNLQQLLGEAVAIPLSSPQVLGFPFKTTDSIHSCSLEGQLVLTAPCNEMVRVMIVKDTVMPQGPASTFDWALAKAARAASALPAPGQGGNSSMKSNSNTNNPNSKQRTSSSVEAAVSSQMQAQNQSGFLSHVKHAADRMYAGILPPRELPTLKTLFETPVESLVIDDDIDFMPENDDDDDGMKSGSTVANDNNSNNNKVVAAGVAAGVAAVAVAGKAKDKALDLASAALQGAATGGAKLKAMIPNVGGSSQRRQSEDNDAMMDAQVRKEARDRRNELLGASVDYSGNRNSTYYRPPVSRNSETKRGTPPPRLSKRTASEIKRTYGHTRSQDAKATMERNRALLAERGEKLRNLEEKSAALQGDAEDFAGMAAELEAAFANRKWWQF